MLLERFLEWCKKSPAQVALISGQTTYTYASLLRRSRFVANALRSEGVGVGDRVVVLLNKSAEAVAAILGVLLAGAAYVPVDPRAPAIRVTQILADCAPKALIISLPHLDRLTKYAPQCLDSVPARFVAQGETEGFTSLNFTEQASVALESDDAVDGLAPEHPAYLLYTSGSTGQPKGVELSQLAARSFVDWARDCFAITATDRLVSFAPLSFDLSIFDLFVTLSSGATVTLVAPEQLLHPRELVKCLNVWGITTLYAVPSTIERLIVDGMLDSTAVPSLSRVLYAGEPFPIKGLAHAMTVLSAARFYNLFGPTETNVCTYHALAEIPATCATSVPIGVACEHLDIVLCDDEGKPVEAGEPGEMYVAGPSVMTGYFGKPELNERAFAPGSSTSDARRYFRTGDYARRDPEGRYWFLGRRDRQVKRRGYRVELGEIEAALLQHPSVQQAATFVENGGNLAHIVAVVTLQEDCSTSPLMLKAHCGAWLPPYLVPDSVRIVSTLPRTLTGKLDLQQLGAQTRKPGT